MESAKLHDVLQQAKKEVEEIAIEYRKKATSERYIYDRAINDQGFTAREKMNADDADQLQTWLSQHFGIE